MERDTGKSFRDIHGSVEMMTAQMDEIERHLTRGPQFDSEFPPLRFVTFRERPVSQGKKKSKGKKDIFNRMFSAADPGYRGEPDSDGVVHLRLTSPGEVDMEYKYIAVSYTWQQSEELEEMLTNAHKVPKYALWTAKDVSRPLRCPPLVLHRALLFARARSDKPLIWIDQECIDQEDPYDVDAHLQIMHEIYRRSTFTVAVLSTTMMELDLLSYAQHGMMITRDRRQFERLLRLLSSDTWFSRTWTFQERYCAARLHYLVPFDPSLQNDALMGSRIDLEIPSTHFGVDAYLENHDPEEWFTRNSAERSTPTNKVTTALHAKAITELNGLSHKFIAAQSEGISRQYSVGERRELIDRTLSTMETCENSVVADRLAIVANICNFSWRIGTADLDCTGLSLSTCILVLLKHNYPEWEKDAQGFWRPGQSGSNKEIAAKLFDFKVENISDALQRFRFLVGEGESTSTRFDRSVASKSSSDAGYEPMRAKYVSKRKGHGAFQHFS